MITRVLVCVAMALVQTHGVLRTRQPGPGWDYPGDYFQGLNPAAAVTSVASVSAAGPAAPRYSVVETAAGPLPGGGYDGPRSGGWKYSTLIVTSPTTTSASSSATVAAAGGGVAGALVYDGGYGGPAPYGGPGYLAVGAGTGGSVISGVAGAVSAASAVGIASNFPAVDRY